MFGFPLLDVMIGLVFVYALLALVCVAANEIYAGLMDRRENHLYAGISNLLGEHARNGSLRQKVPYDRSPGPVPPSGAAEYGVVDAFYDHPLIRSLNEKDTRPSYIPDATFARVMLDMFAPPLEDSAPANKFDRFVAGVKSSLPVDSDLRRALLIIAEDAGGDLAKLQAGLVGWFKEAMNRVTAWYKNQTQTSAILISMVVCLLMNADTIQIVKDLYTNPAKRTVIVAQAEEASKAFAGYSAGRVVKSVPNQDAKQVVDNNLTKLEATGLTWGWEGYYFSLECFSTDDFRHLVLKFLGIMFTAIAVSLGAPFWFDMLGRLINIRAVGKSPEEKAASDLKKTGPAAK
ncbi:MAG: hypothetical protein Q7V04_05355 [Deltaproteobacteria bacterium]|nr:hypothetical protein [Deltaproteobacteria bacterium]